MKKSLIVANWKCNPTTLKGAKLLFDSVGKGIGGVKGVEVVICPPFLYISDLVKSKILNLKIGGQDCFWEEKGAYTGEISASMLKNLGCQYVILGHSERRRYFQETDDMVNKKLKAALKAGLTPILCVGSKKMGEEGGREMEVQLEKALTGIKKTELKKTVFTYEPVWAISTTKGSIAAIPENTKGGAIFIRKILTKLFNKTIAQKARVIYGGSVDSANIRDFIEKAHMDGVLIGAASLRLDDFTAAVRKLDSMSKNC